ncbi:MAG: 5-aminolevulinate synthase [Bacteroidota bacterium]
MKLKEIELLKHKLETLDLEGDKRVFRVLEQSAELAHSANLTYPDGDSKNITLWCSNDYLGMSKNPEVIKAGVDAMMNYGAGSTGVRSLTGTSTLHIQLEEVIAELHQKEAAILYNSGYIANETALNTLSRHLEDLVIFSDELNHNSIIQGIRNGKAKKHIFRHNDADHLRELLSMSDPNVPKLVVFESLYSMDGDFANIRELVHIAKEFGALTYLDEVHAVGIYGKEGRGLAIQENTEIDIIEGTLGKAFGTMGGYIAASKEIVEFLRQRSFGLIYTTSLPPGIIASAIKSIEIVKQADALRQRLKDLTQMLLQSMKNSGYPIVSDKSHIVALLVGSGEKSSKISDYLLENHNILVQAIKYPTVAKGTERLRICALPTMMESDVSSFLAALKEVNKKFSLIYEY